MVEAKLRPRFHLLASFFELFNCNKLNLRDDLFVFLYFIRRTKQHVHNTKMASSDLGGVVVDQDNGFCVECSLNGKLFAHLSFDGILKSLQAEGKQRVIFVIDVSANTDGTFGDQTLFPSFLAANIVKNALSISDHHIRDDLLEIRIDLGLGTRLETVVLLIQDGRQIVVNITSETLKDTELFKN